MDLFIYLQNGYAKVLVHQVRTIGLLTSGFPTKTLYTPLLSLIRATCPVHLILLDLITRTRLGEQYRSLSSSFCNFLHSPFTPSLLGPIILLSTLFSNTLSLCSSLNVSDQVSHPYKTAGKIIVLSQEEYFCYAGSEEI